MFCTVPATPMPTCSIIPTKTPITSTSSFVISKPGCPRSGYRKEHRSFPPERLYDDIDLAETLSNLRGKWIKHITKDHVEFQDGERLSLTDPDWRILKPLVWWQA